MNDAKILELFFEKLEYEQPNVRTYVQDALASMIAIYTDLDEGASTYATVKDIILESVQKVYFAITMRNMYTDSLLIHRQIQHLVIWLSSMPTLCIPFLQCLLDTCVCLEAHPV